MEIIFLGTSSMVPTKDRNQSSIFIRFKTEGMLFDCGEGTQRQLKSAGIALPKITKIFISHWHGDHVLGLPGLLQSRQSMEAEHMIEIYGPKGTNEHFEHMKNAFDMMDVSAKVIEVTKRKILQKDEFEIESLPLDHSVPSMGYSLIEKDKRKIDLDFVKKMKIPEGEHMGKLQLGKDITWKGKKIKAEDATYIQKGRKITVIMDTKLCQNAIELAQESDLLITESTYADKLKDKAEKYYHMTAADAATIANKSRSKRLILTHFSQRYKNTQEIEEDARNIFDNVTCAKDFMKIEL